MFLRKINSKSLFPRLILWSTLGLLISLTIVSSIIYFILSSSLKEKDRQNLHHIAVTIAQAAVDEQDFMIKNFIRPELLIALYDEKGKAISINLPKYIDNDAEDIKEIALVADYAKNPPNQEGWHTIFLDSSPDENSNLFFYNLENKIRFILHDYGLTNLVPIIDNDMFEVLTMRFSNGHQLKIGTSFEPTDEYLAEIREKILYIIIPFIILGLLINIIVAVSVLYPIKKLVETIVRIKNGEKNLRAKTKLNNQSIGDEIDLLAQEFNLLLDKNNILITNLKETVDNIAHDLRTPLTHLNSNLEFAYLNLDDKELIKASIEDGFEDIARILKLLNAILDSSESRTNTMVLKSEKIYLSQFFEVLSDLYQYSLEEKKIDLVINASEELCVFADQTRLFQVFGNLLDNAIKFSPPQTTITIEAKQSDKHIIIHVQDEGNGISDEDLPRVFERLYRGDKSRTTDGVGLGLSIVQSIVKAHNGQISVKSELNKGTTFSLTLPSCNDSVRFL